jgi:hypothetical protein
MSQNVQQLDTEGVQSLLRAKLPYVVVLALAMLGVAYTSISHQTINGYWEFLAIAIGIACGYTGFAAAPDRQSKIKVARTQILHWLAFLVAMNILLLPPVQQLLTTPATGLAMMLLLALGTFVAGIYVSTDIALLGLAMALSVPAIAWLKVSALLLLLVGFAVIGIGLAWWRR